MNEYRTIKHSTINGHTVTTKINQTLADKRANYFDDYYSVNRLKERQALHSLDYDYISANKV